MSMADARFARLSFELVDLLSALRDLEPDPLDLERAHKMADSATRESIGRIIHQLHILINEERTHKAQDEINAYLSLGLEWEYP